MAGTHYMNGREGNGEEGQGCKGNAWHEAGARPEVEGPGDPDGRPHCGVHEQGELEDDAGHDAKDVDDPELDQLLVIVRPCLQQRGAVVVADFLRRDPAHKRRVNAVARETIMER